MANGSNTLQRYAAFDDAERELILAEICGRLAKGEPMTAICQGRGMPTPLTVANWASADTQTGIDIARARDAGFDAIAFSAIRIIDGAEPARTAEGVALQPDANRDKARADVRLKLLAKWDPKRYGEAVQMRMADANGDKLDTTPMVRELLALVRPSDGSQAVLIEGSATEVSAHSKEPPADS